MRAIRAAACIAVCIAACAVPAGAALASTPATVPIAHENYLLRCSGCHRADRRGLPKVGVPPVRRVNLEPLLRTRAGRAYLVQVPGVSQSPLDDRQVAQVLNWLLRGTPGLRTYTTAEVRRDRKSALLNVAAARRRIMKTSQNRVRRAP